MEIIIISKYQYIAILHSKKTHVWVTSDIWRSSHSDEDEAWRSSQCRWSWCNDVCHSCCTLHNSGPVRHARLDASCGVNARCLGRPLDVQRHVLPHPPVPALPLSLQGPSTTFACTSSDWFCLQGQCVWGSRECKSSPDISPTARRICASTIWWSCAWTGRSRPHSGRLGHTRSSTCCNHEWG